MTSCPTCDREIRSISTRGPADHVAGPCGHRVSAKVTREFVNADRDSRLVTDGGEDVQSLREKLADARMPRCEYGHWGISLNAAEGRLDCPVPTHDPKRVVDVADGSLVWEREEYEPGTASLRDGETRDDDVHARRNAEQLAMADDDLVTDGGEDITQTTLTGETTEVSRDRPATLIVCPECHGPVLRSRRDEHPHDLEDTVTESDDDDEPVEKVGGIYDITLSYNVEYRFRVPAYSEHEAKERAEDLRLDAHAADRFLVHSEEREVKEVMSDDPKVPDDWDPYGSEPLWSVYGNGGDK